MNLLLRLLHLILDCILGNNLICKFHNYVILLRIRLLKSKLNSIGLDSSTAAATPNNSKSDYRFISSLLMLSQHTHTHTHTHTHNFCHFILLCNYRSFLCVRHPNTGRLFISEFSTFALAPLNSGMGLSLNNDYQLYFLIFYIIFYIN